MNIFYMLSGLKADFMSLLFFVLTLFSGYIFVHIRYLSDYVQDNQVGMFNWIKGGFYGKPFWGPTFIFWKKIGAELVLHSASPRYTQAIIEESFISEPPPNKPGAPLEVSISFILQMKRNISSEGFVTFHRIEDGFEKAIIPHMRSWIDAYIHDVEEHLSGDETDIVMINQEDVKQKAEKELMRFVDEKSNGGFEVLISEIKLDVSERVKEKMEDIRMQSMVNKQAHIQHQAAKKIASQLKGIPDQLAILIGLKLTGMNIDLGKQIMELQGLDRFKGLVSEESAVLLAQALQKKSTGGGKK